MMNDLWLQWALRPQWQQRLGLTLLALALLALLTAFVWRPLWQARAHAQNQGPELAAAYQTLLDQARQHQLWQARLPQAKADLAQQQQRLPTQPPNLATTLNQLLAAQGLNLVHAQPLADVTLDEFIIHAHAFAASGEAEAMSALLLQLASHPDILIISQLTLQGLPGTATPQLHLEVRLHTLRYRPPEPGQEAPHEAP